MDRAGLGPRQWLSGEGLRAEDLKTRMRRAGGRHGLPLSSAAHASNARGRAHDWSWRLKTVHRARACLAGFRRGRRWETMGGGKRAGQAAIASLAPILSTTRCSKATTPAPRGSPQPLCPGPSAEGGARHRLKVELRCNGARRRRRPHRPIAESSPDSLPRGRGLDRLPPIPHLRCRNPTSITPGRCTYAFGGSSFWLNTRSITSSSSSSENGLVM